MKKVSFYLVLAPSAMWTIPKLLNHWGKNIAKARKNVFNFVNLSLQDVENFLNYLKLKPFQYDIKLGKVDIWSGLFNILSEKDLEGTNSMVIKQSSFTKTLIIGALRSLKVASLLQRNFKLTVIVKALEKWVKLNLK